MPNHHERVAICKSLTNRKGIDTRERIELIQRQMGHKPYLSTLDYIDAKALMPDPPKPIQH